jgi:gamma-glutamyltranspeptidase/glutathione hydrolase
MSWGRPPGAIRQRRADDTAQAAPTQASHALRTFAWALAVVALCSHVQAASPAPVGAKNGMVVTSQHLATRVGVDILKQGGNAVDAAVAVGYALGVVFPGAGNLGGGGFMTLQLADGRKTFIDFREKAPLAASADMYLDRDGNVIRGLSTKGYLAAGVPGNVAGFELALAKYGTMRRGAVIAPAIRLAQRGFVLEQGDADLFAVATADFRADPPSAAIFLDRGEPLKAGQRLVQKDLARTLQRIARNGAGAFYWGPIADAIVAESTRGKGIITKADLAQYRARELAPIECDYRGYRIVSAPPPSSGGVIVCEILGILEGYPLRELGFRSAQAVHYQIEAMRHAYVDRNSYLGDPDFVRNPTERLLDKGYAANIRAAIDPARAGVSSALKPGVAPHEGTNTTHYSIVDRAGNAVAVTYTLNDWFGARVTVAGTGIIMNNEMDDFTVKPGVPNLYGLVQGEANAIAPGKRPLSSMAPTIVSRDGKPVLVIGSPGGSRIITVVMHLILNTVDYGMHLQEAIDATRFHQQWLPEGTFVEEFALSPDTRRMLADMGHKFTDSRPWSHAIGIIVGAPSLGGAARDGNRVFGANDPRRSTGSALGH